VCTKDQKEKIDFQKIFIAVVNWPKSEFLYNTLVWLVCYKPAGQCFPGCGVWGTVDFYSKYKILWGETRAHGVPLHEERKKVQNKDLPYIIIPIFPPPIVSD